MFPLFLSLRNFAVLKRKETVIGVLIAAASWNGVLGLYVEMTSG